jgi:hypothetical protein
MTTGFRLTLLCLVLLCLLLSQPSSTTLLPIVGSGSWFARQTEFRLSAAKIDCTPEKVLVTFCPLEKQMRFGP